MSEPEAKRLCAEGLFPCLVHVARINAFDPDAQAGVVVLLEASAAVVEALHKRIPASSLYVDEAYFSRDGDLQATPANVLAALVKGHLPSTIKKCKNERRVAHIGKLWAEWDNLVPAGRPTFDRVYEYDINDNALYAEAMAALDRAQYCVELHQAPKDNAKYFYFIRHLITDIDE